MYMWQFCGIGKSSLFSIDERLEMLHLSVKELDNVCREF